MLTASGALAYTWSAPPTTSLFPSITVSPAVTSTFMVSGTGTMSCKSSKIVEVVVDACTGIIENEISTEVFPNPCRDHLIITRVGNVDFVVVYDLTGREIIKSELSNRNQIDVSALKPGLYVVSIDKKKIRFVKE